LVVCSIVLVLVFIFVLIFFLFLFVLRLQNNELVVDELVQTTWREWPPRSVDEAVNAVSRMLSLVLGPGSEL